MNFRKIILQKFIDGEILKIIWHCPEQFWILFFYLFFKIILFYWFFEFIVYFISSIKLQIWWLISIIMMFFLLKFIVKFLNTYFESIVITSDWLYVFVWEDFFEHRIDYFERKNIQIISNEQNDFWDKVFGKWDIKIIVMNWIEFRFNEIKNPNKIANYINNMKERYITKQQILIEERQKHQEQENMNTLVSALWEVISEYVKK